MSLTWQELKKTPQFNLEIELLEEVRDNLQNGGKVRIGQCTLTRADLKDVEKLIDKEYKKNGGK